MKLLGRLFVAFCVATVLAQFVVLAMSVAKGNLDGSSLTKAMALVNGIDISGDQLQAMLDEARNVPVPTYEDIRDARAREDRNLQMREDAIRRQKEEVEAARLQLNEQVQKFDRRRDEFYESLDNKIDEQKKASMLSVKRTLEALSPGQAKEQLLKMLEASRKDDVVAIVKEMPVEKQKKILGEFTAPEETDQLHTILMSILDGEPDAGVLQKAREGATP